MVLLMIVLFMIGKWIARSNNRIIFHLKVKLNGLME